MKLIVKHQEKYSRGELLLRTFFGFIYIIIPHMILLWFMGIASAILAFAAWWSILFTGKYPKIFYDFQVRLFNWQTRVNVTMWHLSDGYPAFGLKGASENISLTAEYPEKLSRGLLLLKTFFGIIYVGIPHMFCLYIRMIGSGILAFLAWWAVLFTGKYPESWHAFNVGTIRWGLRMGFYLFYLTDEYPPFSGKE